MKLFGKSGAPALAFGAAMLALVGTTATAEQVDAANQELDAAGIKGAQLVPGATLDELTAKADRVDTAEAAAKGHTDALAAAGVESVAALVAQRDGYKVKADKFDKAPGAGHTTPTLEAGKSDVEETAPDADQETINGLAHNKALDGHPLFGAKAK
jgi:hypothetical protein